MANIGFISLGCAKNQVDCERMMYRVQEAGHDVNAELVGSDVVVINLGTNDNGGTRGGVPITNTEMANEAVAFLTLVREKNPDAVIIWHYGMMGSNRAAAFEDAVAEMARVEDFENARIEQEKVINGEGKFKVVRSA